MALHFKKAHQGNYQKIAEDLAKVDSLLYKTLDPQKLSLPNLINAFAEKTFTYEVFKEYLGKDTITSEDFTQLQSAHTNLRYNITKAWSSDSYAFMESLSSNSDALSKSMLAPYAKMICTTIQTAEYLQEVKINSKGKEQSAFTLFTDAFSIDQHDMKTNLFQVAKPICAIFEQMHTSKDQEIEKIETGIVAVLEVLTTPFTLLQTEAYNLKCAGDNCPTTTPDL